MKNAGVYSKAIVAALGGIVTAVAPYLAMYRWWPAVPAVLTIISVFLVPNSDPVVEPPPAPAVPPAVTPPVQHPVP
jgi:hypothetical protein